MRDEDFKNLLELVATHKTLFVCGEEGSGKTHLLKRIEKELRGVVYFELGSLSKLVNLTCKGKRLKDRNILDKIVKINQNKKFREGLVLLVDNYEMYDSRFKKHLNMLACRKIIASSKKVKNGFVYELKPISYEIALEYVVRVMGNNPLSRSIANSSGGNIGIIFELIKKTKCKDEKEALKIIKNTKPKLNRKPLIKMKDLVTITYFIFFLRFVFYLNNNFKEGFILASLGYLLMIVTRFGKSY